MKLRLEPSANDDSKWETQMSTLEVLRGLEALQDVSDESLEELAAIGREVEFPAGQTIFRQCEKAKDVFLIVRGKVSVAVCDSKVGCRKVAEVTSGGLLGWSPLLRRPLLSAAAQAVEPVQAIAVNGEELLALCDHSPTLGYELMHRVAVVLADRLASTRMHLLDIGGAQFPEVQIESD